MFYIIRHGQTVWNLEKRRQGQQDSPLTWTGVEQAHKLGQELELIPLLSEFKVYCSPLGRVKQFASLALSRQYPWSKVLFDDRLQECDFGKWEGLTNDEIEERFPQERAHYVQNRWEDKGHGGESFADLYARTTSFLEEHKEENVLVFCHEVVSKMMRAHYLGWGHKQIFESNHPQNTFYLLVEEEEPRCYDYRFCK